jgi:hypothetical protein
MQQQTAPLDPTQDEENSSAPFDLDESDFFDN